MLVLSRKVGERIFIGENIIVEVRNVWPNGAKIAIDAPKEIRILRSELIKDDSLSKKATLLPA